MKRYYFIFMLIAALWSCESDTLVEDESTGGRYSKDIISISPRAEDDEELSSRGTPITNVSQMTDIGLFCSYTSSSDWTASAAPGKMFNTKLVRNSSSGKWEYSGPPVSWGAVNGNDRYSFFAYAPYASAQNGIVVQGSSATAGVPSIIYTTPTDVTMQPDLMLATPRYNLRPSTSMVALQMKHALTCVGFQIQGNGEQVKSVSISGISTSGTVKLIGDNVAWTNLNSATTVDYSALINFDTGKTYYTATPTMSTNLIAGNGYLMMIPQALTTNTKLKLTFSDNTTRVISLNNQTWTAGKKITYNIIITPQGIITISPSSYYIPAMGVTQLTDNFQLSCTPANIPWTLTTNVTWLRLTTNANGSNAAQSISGQGAATIYTIADANTASIGRVAPLYANGNLLSAVGTINQLRKIDLTTITNGGDAPMSVPTYVGAFWRASQTGERIIRIPVGASSANAGLWVASVEWLDSQWSPSDIRISSALSLDVGVSYTTDAEPGDAELYKVTDKNTAVSGTVASNGSIYFRIGLNSTYTSTVLNPARYAVIILTYNNQARSQLILLRQGEEADYVMRPTDPATGSYVNPTRPFARKVAAFNITQSTITSWIGGSLITDHPTLLFRGGTFTEYPTQGGAYFQWAVVDYPCKAYHPVNPIAAMTSWSITAPSLFWEQGAGAPKPSSIFEVCPTGYKRINDGPENSATTLKASTSELRQSLFYKQVDDVNAAPINNIRGYYADGFFDRRMIKSSPTGVAGTVVSYYTLAANPLNAKIAYAGSLLYNPTTWASVFLPATGARNQTTGSLTDAGQQGYYLTASSLRNAPYAIGFLVSSSYYTGIGYEFPRSHAGSVRCVKIP